MAGTHRGSSADLNHPDQGDMLQALLRNGRAFSFFQAVRLLRQQVKQGMPAGGPQQMSDRIRIRPKLSLAFPAADIDRIEQDTLQNDAVFRITANFMGLYGCTSPLPTFYTEDLIEEAAQDESVSRDFLDIINQRIYDLLFQGWLKYRQFLQVAEEKNSEHLERLYCLLGLGSEISRRHDPVAPVGAHALLRYIGLFTQFPRSAAGLNALLTDGLQETSLRVEPCITRQAKIPANQQFRMGMSGNRLGEESYVGEEIEDRMGKFRIRIGPLDSTAFFEFTPGNSKYNTLVALTWMYLTEPLACEVELILAPHEAETVCLGHPRRAVLGVSSWVFSEPFLGEVRTRFDMQPK